MPTPRIHLSAGDLALALDQLDIAVLAGLGPDIVNCDPDTGAVAYLGGTLRDGAGGLVIVPDGAIVCPALSTVIVQIDPTTGVVSQAATLDNRKLGMMLVTTGTSVGGPTIHVEDIRDCNLGWRLNVQNATGTVVSERTQRIRFHGPGVNPVGDGLGGVDVEVLGAGGSGHPIGPLPDPADCELFVDASDVGGVTDGNPMTAWPDQSPVATDPANAGGTDRPTFRLADGEDGLPFIECDGVDDFFARTGMTAYTGTELSMYVVYRSGLETTNTRGIVSFAKAGGTDNGTAGRFVITKPTQYRALLNRASNLYEANTSTGSGASFYDGAFTWAALALRWKMVMGRGVLTMMHNSRIASFDIGAALVALDFAAVFLGCRHVGGDGTTPDNFGRTDFRHFSYKHSADSILTMRDTIRHLAPKWGVPLFD